jgi:anti-anti-sigma factor
VIIRQLNRASACAAAQDGGSETSVITAVNGSGERPPRAHRSWERFRLPHTPLGADPVQVELSCRTEHDGSQVISVTGELDIATAEQAYTYIRDVIDCWPEPVSVDLAGLTFCDAAGLGALARVARHARQAGRPLRLISARPSLLKIMRITGLDGRFPELRPPVSAY